MITAAGRYDATPDLTQLYQGDVIAEIPFPKWPTFTSAAESTKWGILRPSLQGDRSLEEALRTLPNQLVGRAAKDVPDRFQHSNRELVIASCQLTDVMIVSRSCALDNTSRKHALIAPITPVASLPGDQRGEDKLLSLRQGDIPHFFYFPETALLPECFADLHKITAVHRSFFPSANLDGKLRARLTSRAMKELQFALADHFGTRFGFDHEDICPQDGVYRCSTCFHSGRMVVDVRVTAGVPFGACVYCGDNAAFVKISGV
jgi:hypothetical protein